MELNEEENWIIKVLREGFCFTQSSGYHSEKLRKLFLKKFKPKNDKRFQRAIQHLRNEGILGEIRKKEIKYYVNMKKVREI